jgi:L-lactate dehydrogenase
MSARFSADVLIGFAEALLVKTGLPRDRAGVVAEILVEGDLLGHDTHGLNLLPGYLDELVAGRMMKTGMPEVISKRTAVALWDGKRLPGPWLLVQAIDEAIAGARTAGSYTIVIRRSHHIACLAAFLKRATDHGMVMLLLSSDPNTASVAPFSGTQGVFTPNPLAFGVPTSGEPILVDISASITTNGMSARLANEGRRFSFPCLLDAQGAPTDDPTVFAQQPPGTILPLGGLDAGHKGYGLALVIESLTGGLAGFGRADPPPGWGATVYLQVSDPEAFGGRAPLQRQLDWIVRACHENKPRPGVERVRLPGERALAQRRAQLRDGVALHASILPQLEPWSKRLEVPMPPPVRAA